MEVFGQSFESCCGAFGSNGLFVPSGSYRSQAPTQVVVLEHGRNPTTDYYIRPRLRAAELPRSEIVDISRTRPEEILIPSGTFLIIVRYLTGAWSRYLQTMRDRFCRVVYFVDDDLPAVLRSSSLPLRYRYKIFSLFSQHRAVLASLCSEIWVSNESLARKFGLPLSSVLVPLPVCNQKTAAPQVTYFYAGTASHRDEFVWLARLVNLVQHRSDALTFITFGGSEVNRLFRDAPRVLCLHPVAWPTFLESTPALRLDIGLAPLLPGAFSASRSHIKFYDITRLGAIGIYSNVPPYADFVQSGVDGICVDNEPEQWYTEIMKLVAHPERRAALRERARARADEMAGYGAAIRLSDCG